MLMMIIITTMMLMMLMIIITILRMMMTMLFGNDENTQHLWKPLKTLFYRPIQLRKLPVYNPEDERIGDLFGWKFCDFDCWIYCTFPVYTCVWITKWEHYPMIQNVTSEKGKLGNLFFAFMWRRPADMRLKLCLWMLQSKPYMFHSFYHAWVALQFAKHVIHDLIGAL